MAPLILLSACQSRTPQPVPIESSDMCGRCRMAVSQKQFAAQLFDAEENSVKFDDIGCLLRWLDTYGKQPLAIYVADYPTRQWSDAHNALYVRAPKVATPMGGGILAFAERGRAERAAHEFGATVLTFSEIMKDKPAWNLKQSP